MENRQTSDCFETLFEAELDAHSFSSLTRVLSRKSAGLCRRKDMFVFIKRDKLTLGSLPYLKQKTGKSLMAAASCLSEESIIKTLQKRRQILIIILNGICAIINKSETLAFISSKIRREFWNRNIIHRRLDPDVLVSLFCFNFNWKDEENGHTCDGDSGFIHKSVHQEKKNSNATRNKNTTKLKNASDEKAPVLCVHPRKIHTPTVVDFEMVANPNNSPKFKRSNYGRINNECHPTDEKIPIQATETDAGQSSLEPSVGSLPCSSNLVASGNGIRSSVKPPRYRDYVDEDKRASSFHTPKWEANNKPDVCVFAEWGFFFTGVHDLVRCHQCGIGMKDWIKEDDVLNEHVRYSPKCEFLVQKLGQPQINRMTIALINPAGDATPSNIVKPPYKVRSPRYQTMDARLASFKNFPQSVQIAHREMAVAGLFYTGEGDLCRCFTCDGGLKDWGTGDNPVKEHAKYFPHCSYINQLKGQEYVKQQQRRPSDNVPMGASGGSGTKYPATHSSSEIPKEKLTVAYNGSKYSSHHVSQVVQKCGFTETDVITAKAELERKGIQYPTADEIVSTILDLQKQNQDLDVALNIQRNADDLKTLLNERDELTRIIFCLLCVTGEADILFLPCSHHRICHECAVGVTVCPVCNKHIIEKVKTFRS